MEEKKNCNQNIFIEVTLSENKGKEEYIELFYLNCSALFKKTATFMPLQYRGW